MKGLFMRFSLLHAGGAVGVAAAAVLAMAVAPADATTTTGTGSAYGAGASVSLLPGVLGSAGITIDTGDLAATSTAGPTSASTVDASLKGLVSAKVITSSSRHDTAADAVRTDAKIVHVALPVLAVLAGATPTASVITSECHGTASGVTGSSNLADLNLGKIGHVSAATPNLKLGIPGVVQIVANEQIHNADGSLTVNALDIKLLGGSLTGAVGTGRIVLASSTCAKTAALPGNPGVTSTRTPPPATTTAPPSGSTSPGTGEVSIVPAGAPETGDGTLATVIVR
jgi:hypothetical protein